MGTTQQDVASRAKVSRALVSLVMRDAPNVSESSRRKVLRAAEELGYRPNAFARSLASKRLHTIGVLVNDVTNPYFGGLFASLAEAARDAGYDILTAPGTRAAGSEAGLVNTLLEHQVAGLALLSPLMATSELRLITATRPTVVVGRELSIAGVDVVTIDEDDAARRVVTHLYDHGHRHIAHITGGRNRPSRDREKAFRKTMTQFGLQARVVPGSFTDDGGRRGVMQLLAEGDVPTAVVGANDLNAVGAIGALRSSGLRVPDDVSVVGYDDSQIARLDVVQLTSVRQPIEEFGRAAVATLLERIEDPARDRSVQRLGTELVERSTVGPAHTAVIADPVGSLPS
jgi:DNA-binding LacI/PurR family transcriptional regulator